MVAALKSAPWLAVDTEFVREKTYFPELCLVQISDGRSHWLVDVQIDGAKDALRELFLNEAVTKVLHSASQDMEVLLLFLGDMPKPIFDTQIAAALLGHGEQIGYAALVQKMTGVELAKTHSRTDWSRRPLSQEEQQYAVDDVRYLAEFYPKLLDDLLAKNRLKWLKPDFDALTNSAKYLPDPDNAWKRVKGSKRLKPRDLKATAALARWREEKAVAKNRPRRWILKDEVLLDLARRAPKNRDALLRIQGISDREADHYGETWKQMIDASRNAENIAVPDKPELPTADQESLVDLLMCVLKDCGKKADIATVMLGSRGDVTDLVMGRKSRLNDGWRQQVVGQPLAEVLAGKTSLAIKNGQLKYEKAATD